MSTRTARVAGVDTREAKSVPTVRAAARAAALIAGPAWLVAFAAPFYWTRWIDTSGAARAWMPVALLFTALASATFAKRLDPLPPQARDRIVPMGGDAALILLLLASFAAAPRRPELVAIALAFVPALAGWTIGRAARMAMDACAEPVRSAAAGLVVTAALAGSFLAVHLALVLRGSGRQRAAVWAIAYIAVGIVALARAGRSFPRDRARAASRAVIISGSSPAEADAALVLSAITVQFGSRVVLAATDLHVASGEVVALVGGNGAGKSTLLRVAAGLLESGSGRVLLHGEDVTALLAEERAAAGLAFVTGARPAFPDLTVEENLRVAAFRTHLTARAFARATDAVLELVPALADRRRSKAGVLSGGEQRLLAVAQTLYRRPKVLLADELSLGLDESARAAVLGLLRVLADEGVAVVCVDHDLPTLLPRADRAMLLATGVITEFTPAARILDARADLLPASFLAGVRR